jgi:hypothetical protein
MHLIGLAFLALAQRHCTVPPNTSGTPDLRVSIRLTVEVRSLSGEAVADQEVEFLDTAPPRGDRGCPVFVGKTDSTGKLEVTFAASWPDYFAVDRRPDAGTFDILVGDRVVHASVECLPRDGQELKLAIGVLTVPPHLGHALPDGCHPKEMIWL